MFNVVGYMNYRYFFLFLLWVLVTCVYGLGLTAFPFIDNIRAQHARGGRIRVGGKWSPEVATLYTFVLALSVGIAVGLLFFWHVYLVLTAQTTIEFYGNQTRAYRARLRGLSYRNPYDMGSARGNWEAAFGRFSNPFFSIFPSSREPPMPPWPKLAPEAILSEHIV